MRGAGAAPSLVRAAHIYRQSAGGRRRWDSEVKQIRELVSCWFYNPYYIVRKESKVAWGRFTVDEIGYGWPRRGEYVVA